MHCRKHRKYNEALEAASGKPDKLLIEVIAPFFTLRKLFILEKCAERCSKAASSKRYYPTLISSTNI